MSAKQFSRASGGEKKPNQQEPEKREAVGQEISRLGALESRLVSCGVTWDRKGGQRLHVFLANAGIYSIDLLLYCMLAF